MRKKQKGKKSSAQEIDIIERQNHALRLRKTISSYRDIAEKMREIPGVSPQYNQSQAFLDVKNSLQRLTKENQNLSTSIMALEWERYEDMIIPQYQAALEGSPIGADTANKLIAQRAKLFGLAKPDKTALTDPSGEHQADLTLTDQERVERLSTILAKALNRANGKDE